MTIEINPLIEKLMKIIVMNVTPHFSRVENHKSNGMSASVSASFFQQQLCGF